MKQVLRSRSVLVTLIVVAAVAAGVGAKVTSHSIPTGAATVQLIVDSPQSALADLKQDPLPLVSRAQVFAQLMSSSAVLDAIAKAAGVPASDLTAEGPYSGAAQSLDVPTPSEARGVQLVATNVPYHFTFVPDTNIPLITASVQGPSPAAAGKLANAVYPGIQAWLRSLQSSGKVPKSTRVTIRQLGDAEAGRVNASSSTTLAGMAGVAVLLIGFVGLFAVEARRRARESDEGLALLDPGGYRASELPDESNGHGFGEAPALVLPHGVVGYDPGGVTAGWPDEDATDGEPATGFDHPGGALPASVGFPDNEPDGSNPPRTRRLARILNR